MSDSSYKLSFCVVPTKNRIAGFDEYTIDKKQNTKIVQSVLQMQKT